MLDAGEFVPLAEEAGLVYGLDDTIVRCAVEARANLPITDVDSTFRIWCNISAGQFTRARPIERLTDLLERTGCDAEPDRARDHRDRDPSRRASGRARDRRRAGARHQGRARRLRHRALVADAVAFAADRPGEDRPDLRAASSVVDARATAIVRSVVTLAKDLGSRSRGRGRGDAPSRPRCSASSAVSSRRVTCGRRRCRPSSSRRRCGRNVTLERRHAAGARSWCPHPEP